MPYASLPFRDFGGGLNLRDKVDVVSERDAIDILNVTLSTRGVVGQRYGYAKFTASAGTNFYDSLTNFYKADGTRRLIAGAGNRLEAIDTTGALVGGSSTSTAPTASPHYFTRFGGYTTASNRLEAIYAANGTDQLRKYDTTNGWSTPAGLAAVKGKFVAGWGLQNRLVSANTPSSVSGSLSRPSRVEFSDVGDPETFSTNNFVEITPGDGEQIMGICTWREFLFVFKETRFAVFYGESVAADGTPVFNYRMVDAGVGLSGSRALCVGRDGVYFLNRKGIYRTSGADPALLSDIIDPFFTGDASIYFQSSTINQGSVSTAAMEWMDEKLYCSVPTGSATTNDRMLVYDPRYGWWSLFDIPANDLCNFRVSTGNDELMTAYPSGTKDIGRYKPTVGYSADNMSTTGTGGTAITSRWRSGWLDAGSMDEKSIREMKVWGSGTTDVALSYDYRLTPSAYNTVAFSSGAESLWDTAVWDVGVWGPVGTISEYLARDAVNRRGAVFSLSLRNSTLNQTWALHRAVLHLRETASPSKTKVDN